MKKFIVLIFLSSFCCTYLFANQISDFQFDNISVGDKLTNFLDENEIKTDSYIPKSQTLKKYKSIVFLKNLQNYQALMINFKENYDIGGISAFVKIQENINSCKNKKEEIVNEISYLFEKTKKQETTKPLFYDKNSTVYGTHWRLSDGFIRVACYDHSKESGTPIQLRIDAADEEYLQFLSDQSAALKKVN